MTPAENPRERLSFVILDRLRGWLGEDTRKPELVLHRALRLLAKWRAETLKGPAMRATGGVVWSGPFAGMAFRQGATEGCFIPKLLGCYESELHEHWLSLRATRRYAAIVDVGSAEGYYAVGLARLFPEATVVARDTESKSHPMIRQLAIDNGVADRLDIGGLFAHADFAAFADRPTLVLCDIEGAEKELLDPLRAPALGGMDIVVEAHDGMDAAISGTLTLRFEATHDIVVVHERMRDIDLPSGYQPRDSIDRWISVWEFRSSPTPWLVMRARAFAR